MKFHAYPRPSSPSLCDFARKQPASNPSPAVRRQSFPPSPQTAAALNGFPPQQQPVVARVLDRPAARLHQPLLQTAQRPVDNPPWQHQPPPEVPQVVSNYDQPKPHLVGPESMATQPRHLHCLLAFLDPLLG